MTPTAVALLGYAAWTLVLVLWLGLYRTSLVMAGGRQANSFSPAGDDVDDFGRRLTRAHANCAENLPIAGAVLLFALAAGQAAVTDGLAYIFLAARLAQSITHLLSTANRAILVRFGFFLIQVAILFFWILRLAGVF
ncbi:MAG: MAPEG family protein [Parvularculaceae bacterium]